MLEFLNVCELQNPDCRLKHARQSLLHLRHFRNRPQVLSTDQPDESSSQDPNFFPDCIKSSGTQLQLLPFNPAGVLQAGQRVERGRSNLAREGTLFRLLCGLRFGP